MLILVTEKNIKQLIANSKLNIPYSNNKYELSEYESFLIDFFNGNNLERKIYTFSEADSFLRKAKNASILVCPDLAITSVEQIVNTLNKINEKTISNLSDIYRSFYLTYDKDSKIKGRNNRRIFETTNLSENIAVWVKKIFKNSDKIIEDLSISTLEKLTDISSLYRILKPFMPVSYYDNAKDIVVRHTDVVINKILSNKFLDSFDPANAQEVLKKLTSETLANQKLSPEELSKIIKQASSILNFSSAEKIDSCIDIIAQYRNHLLSLADNDLEFQNFVNNNITFKKLLTRSATIISASPESNKINFMLLSGQTIGAINQKLGKSAITKCSAEELQKFKNIKINLSHYDLYHLLTNNTSILSLLSISKIIQIVDSFESAILEAEKANPGSSRFKTSHFKLEELLNRKNIFQLITVNEQGTNFIPTLTENIITLNSIMKSSEIFKVMQNNISVLLQDSDTLKKDISDIKIKYGSNLTLLSSAINAYVNQHFTKIADFSAPKKSNHSSTGHKTSNPVEKLELIINPNEEFHIEVDGGLYQKAPTFSEKIKTYTISDCFEEINKILASIKEKLSSPAELFIYSPSQTKNQIRQLKQLFDMAENFISNLSQTDKYSARSYNKYLSELKDEFATISNFCKETMASINDLFGYTKISKHKKPSKKGSTTQTLDELLTLSQNADDPVLKEQLKSMRNELLKKNKEKIKSESIEANQDRIKEKLDYEIFNSLYEYCSIISFDLDKKLLESDEKIKE